ncbi:MAG: hypothetical protein WC703_10945, partial [Candidatus Neomarinimicrobiota bacterium]
FKKMLGENVRNVVCHFSNRLRFPCMIDLNERIHFNFFGAPLTAVPERVFFQNIRKNLKQ